VTDVVRLDGASQKLLLSEWGRQPCDWHDAWLKVCSQNGEDGYLLWLLAQIGPGKRTAVELCVGDGTECCTANLVLAHGWQAWWFEGDEGKFARLAERYTKHPATYVWPPTMVRAWLTPATINGLFEQVGVPSDPDVLVIDVDGQDYWLWEAMTCEPDIVVVEYHDLLGPEAAWTMPRLDDWRYDFEANDGFTGASLGAFIELGRRKGYRYVGSEARGYNAFFVLEEAADYAGLREADPGVAFLPGSLSHAKWKANGERLAGLPWVEVCQSGKGEGG